MILTKVIDRLEELVWNKQDTQIKRYQNKLYEWHETSSIICYALFLMFYNKGAVFLWKKRNTSGFRQVASSTSGWLQLVVNLDQLILRKIVLTTFDAGYALVAQWLTHLFELKCPANKGFKWALEVLDQVVPLFGFYVQSFQNRWQLLIDRTSFSLSDDPSTPVYQIKIVR